MAFPQPFRGKIYDEITQCIGHTPLVRLRRLTEGLVASVYVKVEAQNPGDFGFHYEPYNFDSNPEKHFFQEVLAMVNLRDDPFRCFTRSPNPFGLIVPMHENRHRARCVS